MATSDRRSPAHSEDEERDRSPVQERNASFGLRFLPWVWKSSIGKEQQLKPE